MQTDSFAAASNAFNSSGLLDLAEWRFEGDVLWWFLRGPYGDTPLPGAYWKKFQMRSEAALKTWWVCLFLCCRRKLISLYRELSQSNGNKTSEVISEDIEKQWQLLTIIRQWKHTKRRLKGDKICQLKSMCTLVIKVLKNANAIPKCSLLHITEQMV